jgi:hypothetical protein
VEGIQPPQFSPPAENPRPTPALHPHRSVEFDAGVLIEGATHPEQQTDLEPVAVAVYPELLLGRAQTDPESIGFKEVQFHEKILFACGSSRPFISQRPWNEPTISQAGFHS